MPRTIILTRLKIHQWLVDIENKRVIVNFSLLDDSDRMYETYDVTFWRNLPPESGQFDFQLPAAAMTQLQAMTQDIITAITNRFLV